VLELGEDESGLDYLGGSPGAGGDALEDGPALGERGESSLSLAAQAAQQAVAGFRAGVEPLVPAGVLDRDADADSGSLVAAVGQRRHAEGGGAVEGRQGVGAGRAAATLRRVRSPPAAFSFSARHAVGTDATCPNTSPWSPITRKSLITRAPSAIAQARSAKTRPRSRPPPGVGSAADRPAVRPVRSASCRSSTRPACDTTPVPPPATSRPRDHAVAFMQKMLLEMD
jgi:hypothetical protein